MPRAYRRIKHKRTGEIVGLMLVKRDSTRLPGKNTLPFKGRPMYQINLEKCLNIFTRTFVSSDCLEILTESLKMGAIPILRGPELCGDCPNILVYQDALRCMGKIDGIVAVQANSPTLMPGVIHQAIKILSDGAKEVMTKYLDDSIYGSVWAIGIELLREYPEELIYNPKPGVLILDKSIDIHTEEDYLNAQRQ